jgi:predicted nucleic acid-binding protein
LIRIVCDTGPLLHLREAGCLEILQTAGEITIPPAVRAELISHDPFWDRHMPDWIEPGILEPGFLESAARWLQAGLLDPGKAEALSLAAQLKAGWLLTDDAAARLIAQQQG